MWQQLLQWFLVPFNQKLCLSVIAAFVVGLLIGRFVRPLKEKKRRSIPNEGEKAFFKGVQYILSNDHDQAIEELTRSVQINSDTIETYMALANLYRSKGDFGRALRIRQSIILRPSIDEQVKLQAMIDMGLDYRKGGFLNRALETYLHVIKKHPSSLITLEELEKIYEDIKDWGSAFATRQKIAALVKGDHSHILAHHQTELGKTFQEKGELSKAKACFTKAISIYEGCVDAYLHMGDLYFSNEEYKKAVTTWKKIVMIEPHFTFLSYRRLEGAYSRMENLKPVEDFLRDCAQLKSDAFTHMALARYLYNEKDAQGAIRELKSALELDPSFWEARKFMGEILLQKDMKEEALLAYGDLIQYLDIPYLKFQCAHCGFKPGDLLWQCPQCRKWDTIDFIDSKKTEYSLVKEDQFLTESLSRPDKDDS